MSSEHDELVAEYQKYKDEATEYDKKLYFYNSKIEEYANSITEQLHTLNELGVELPELNKYVDDNGEIDLTDMVTVRKMIDYVYSVYRHYIDEGLKLLHDRGEAE